MGSKLFFSLLFILFSANAEQGGKGHRIYWHTRNIISWRDFRSVSKLPGNEAAQISTGIQYSVKMENQVLSFEVKSFADKRNSFYIKKDKNPLLLKHEQGHFDICEIFARRFRKQLQNSKFKQRSISSEVKKIYQHTNKELNKFQQLYDKETNHSIDTVMQSKWNIKIAEMIKVLEPYKDVQFTCTVY